MNFYRSCGTGFFFGLAMLVLTGCATTRKIDWNARVGNYTYDQIVLEIGPPDKLAQLEDGTKVAEWLTGRGYSHGTYLMGGGYYYGGPWIGHYSAPPAPDSFIRLTFGPDGVLRDWKPVIR